MSDYTKGYTPTDWQDGDVITEEKIDHIEEGVADAHAWLADLESQMPDSIPEKIAVVRIDLPNFQNNGATLHSFVCYYRNVENGNILIPSIESKLDYIDFKPPYKEHIYYASIPLPDQSDEFKAALCFEIADLFEDYEEYLTITRTGGVQPLITYLQPRLDETSWGSVFYAGFPITGSGTITIIQNETITNE